MARSISQIQNQILQQIAADPVLSGLNSTSASAIYKLWTYYIANSQAIEEQLNDQFVNTVEGVAAILPPGTLPWIQEQAFLFQYSSTTPQIIQFNTTTFAPYYPTVNPTLRIVKNCSVSLGTLNNVNIKVAKGVSPSLSPLNTAELAAFQYYMNQIKPAGVYYACTSGYADRLWTKATIYYQGAYSGVIGANLLAAYNNYLNTIPFGGEIQIVDVVLALRAVTGVNDVVINTMQARAASTGFGFGTQMVTANTTINPEYTTVTGYISDENTAGYDFLSQVVLIAE